MIREKLMEDSGGEIGTINQGPKDSNLSLQEAVSVDKGNVTSSVSAFTAFELVHVKSTGALG